MFKKILSFSPLLVLLACVFFITEAWAAFLLPIDATQVAAGVSTVQTVATPFLPADIQPIFYSICGVILAFLSHWHGVLFGTRGK